MSFGNKEIQVGVHTVPLRPGHCRVEHWYRRNFLKSKIFNFIFKKIALKYLTEDVTIVNLVQNSYEQFGRSWETSTLNDKLANYLRNLIKRKYPDFKMPYSELLSPQHRKQENVIAN